MPKKITDEEKILRYNETIQKQIARNVKWVNANKDKYNDLMCTYAKNYYEKNKEEINMKRTLHRKKKKMELSPPPPPLFPYNLQSN